MADVPPETVQVEAVNRKLLPRLIRKSRMFGHLTLTHHVALTLGYHVTLRGHHVTGEQGDVRLEAGAEHVIPAAGRRRRG